MSELVVSVWQPARAPIGDSGEDFLDWVLWFDAAYELGVPACWLQHEGLVHVLSALWLSWRQAYTKPAKENQPGPLADNNAPVAWHTYHFSAFRRDLLAPETVRWAKCKAAGKHREDPYRPTLSTVETLPEEAYYAALSGPSGY